MSPTSLPYLGLCSKPVQNKNHSSKALELLLTEQCWMPMPYNHFQRDKKDWKESQNKVSKRGQHQISRFLLSLHAPRQYVVCGWLCSCPDPKNWWLWKCMSSLSLFRVAKSPKQSPSAMLHLQPLLRHPNPNLSFTGTKASGCKARCAERKIWTWNKGKLSCSYMES